MATKTISIDLEAYEALRRRKRRGESFSDVIKNHFAQGVTGLEFLGMLEHVGLDASTLEGVSVHVLCELHAGAELSKDPEAERARVESLARPLAHSLPEERFPPEQGRLLAELRRRGETISTMDLLIATAAIVDEAALVTRHAREFERVPGLRVLAY